MRYTIIRFEVWVPGYGSGAHLLPERVNAMIEDGWQPCGGLYIGKMETDATFLCQAMYKPPTPSTPSTPHTNSTEETKK